MFENTTPVPSQNEATRWKVGFNVSQLISIDGRLFSNARTDIWDSILLSQELGQLIIKDGRLLSNTRLPVAMNGW